MTIPFLNYFKRSKTNGAAKEEAPKPVLPPLEKPISERFSKTVMPNATRTVAPQDPFEMAARATTLGIQAPAAVASGPRTAGAGASAGGTTPHCSRQQLNAGCAPQGRL